MRREDVAGRHLAEVSKAGFQLSDTTSKSRARRPGSPMSFPRRGVRASKINGGLLGTNSERQKYCPEGTSRNSASAKV